jgi:hypothetical protein
VIGEAEAGSGSKHKRKRELETTGLNAASDLDEHFMLPSEEARLNVTYWPIGGGHEIALMDDECRRDSVMEADEMVLHDIDGSAVKKQKSTSERTEPKMLLSGDHVEE